MPASKLWHNVADYTRILKNLLPLGSAWTRVPDSNLHKLLAAMSEEFARVDTEAKRAINEINPLTTMELLPEWETVCGLPDECSPAEALSFAARRAAVLQKLRRPVGQHPAFYEALAADYGYPAAKVEEFSPFRAEVSGAEDRLNDMPGGYYLDEDGQAQPSLYDGWLYVWLITLGAAAVRYFTADESGAEERLAEWGDIGMECRIRRAAPAHTLVIFAYDDTFAKILPNFCRGNSCQ